MPPLLRDDMKRPTRQTVWYSTRRSTSWAFLPIALFSLFLFYFLSFSFIHSFSSPSSLFFPPLFFSFHQAIQAHPLIYHHFLFLSLSFCSISFLGRSSGPIFILKKKVYISGLNGRDRKRKRIINKDTLLFFLLLLLLILFGNFFLVVGVVVEFVAGYGDDFGSRKPLSIFSGRCALRRRALFICFLWFMARNGARLPTTPNLPHHQHFR